MKEYLKKNWKPITAAALAFCAVGAAAYYVNCVYIPGRAQARAAELDAAQVVPVDQKEPYHYTINTDDAQSSGDGAQAAGSGSAAGSATNPANDRIKVTTDASGNVTVDRTWDAKPGELDTSTASPTAPTANIGSGGGKITGEDGAYHGEQPATPPAETKPTPETKPDKPSTPETKPDKPSGGSTPKDGDHRVVDGKEQEYWADVDTWVDVGDGGHTDYIEMPDELSGVQVGEMG